jgi:hypothetical protein
VLEQIALSLALLQDFRAGFVEKATRCGKVHSNVE